MRFRGVKPYATIFAVRYECSKATEQLQPSIVAMSNAIMHGLKVISKYKVTTQSVV